MRLKVDPPDLQTFDSSSEDGGDKDLAERLTQLICNLDHGSVAIFDGRWGVGKTTFVKRWLAYLKSKDIPSIYLDAFSVDYLENPFVALAGAFAKAAEDQERTTHPTYKAFVGAATKVGKTIGGTAAKIGVKFVTLGLIGSSEIEALSDMKDAIADAVSEDAGDAVKALIEEHAQKQSELYVLKEKLRSFPALLADKPEGAEAPPLVVMIDELDRCRPDFALGMIETIKHFFGAGRIHFFLVTNREHLTLSVAHRYGEFPTADEYLRKFYDFQVSYEQDYSERGGIQIRRRVEQLANSLLQNVTAQEKADVIEYVRAAAMAHRLTLRDLEGVFLNITLAYAAVRSKQFRPAILITFLALLKTIDPSLYAKAKSGTLQYDQLASRMFAQDNWGQFNIERLRELFRFHLDPNIDEDAEEWRHFGQGLWNYNLGRLQTVKYLCDAVLDRFAPAQET